MTGPAVTPEPPYSVVVFSSVRTDGDAEAYAEAAAAMMALAAEQPGFLGVESARDPATGFGITVSYWTDEAAIAAWRAHAEHRVIQRLGRERWYRAFRLRVGRIERQRAWTCSDARENRGAPERRPARGAGSVRSHEKT